MESTKHCNIFLNKDNSRKDNTVLINALLQEHKSETVACIDITREITDFIEYRTLILGLKTAREEGVENVTVHTKSSHQENNDPFLEKLISTVVELTDTFKSVSYVCDSNQPVEEYELFFDGASKGNPGPSGIGIVIRKNNNLIAKQAQKLIDGTNNVAEYRALLLGLKHAHDLGIEKLAVYGDSKLVINQMKREWKVKAPHLLKLRSEALKLANKFDSISYTWIGRESNKEADKLANIAIEDADF